MRADMWRLRLSRRNIFAKIFRRTHALPKKEHTHIERKIGEVGRTVAAHGYPAAEEATIHTVQRNALVIDFEKGIDRAKDSSVKDERYWRPTAIPVLASQNPFQRACSAPSSVYKII
ncbi:MAG: hypothetical protein FRX48_04728 [Lasallia pustulata]|uniref:Uncharacterized protein n=1 Tax=Lasallia pustulata TaxID=136370 RepID=A0A5M8PPK2_9LECA|nr:MAG: hypothetical protein FRX48_04728 [Lasallia pustulata]